MSIHQELVVLVIPGYHVSMKSAVVTDWGVEGEPLPNDWLVLGACRPSVMPISADGDSLP